MVAASPPRDVALIGGDGAEAEFARECSAGVFQLKLRLAGEVRYPPGGRRPEECPVKMLMARATAPRASGSRRAGAPPPLARQQRVASSLQVSPPATAYGQLLAALYTHRWTTTGAGGAPTGLAAGAPRAQTDLRSCAAKAFAAGVILANGLVHMLHDAQHTLSSLPADAAANAKEGALHTHQPQARVLFE